MTVAAPGTESKRLPHSHRLRRPEAFRAVLRQPQRRGEWLAISARPNQAGHSRLGLIVARRVVPTAVARNHCKRLIREVFRHLHQTLPDLDLVVRVLKQPSSPASRRSARAELFELLRSAGR